MFNKLLKYMGLIFFTSVVLVLGQIFGKQMWLEGEAWYGKVITVITILTYYVMYGAVAEKVWKSL